VQQLNVRITDEEAAALDFFASQTEGIITKQGLVRLLIRQAQASGWDPLTSAPSIQTMGEPAARRASNTLTSSSKNTSNNSLSMSIPAELESERDLIEEFWRLKKGSKGATAWKLLMTELGKLRSKHGSSVVREQLTLAINGKLARHHPEELRAVLRAQGQRPQAAGARPCATAPWSAQPERMGATHR